MIIRNKSNRLFTVTDKNFQSVCLQPNDVCEVEDLEWKGYLANYGDILTKVEDPNEAKSALDRIAKLEETVAKLAGTQPAEPVAEATEDEVEQMIAFLRENGVKNASRKRSVEVLTQKVAEIKSAQAEAEPVAEPVDETPAE